MTEHYLFGDTDLAAQRLEVLDEVFAASSEAFLRESAESSPRLAVDLGCGPGYTTHMLADVLECDRTVGLDSSEHFIGLAKKTATDRISFGLHDVTTAPFPVGPCDLLYARFLLTHQRDPEGLIAEWAAQLLRGGQLLLEEVDSIHIGVSAFAEYIQIVEAMLANGGYDLYVGKTLASMSAADGLMRRSSRVACVTVTNYLAATMFSMNIRTWKQNAFIQQNYSPASIRQLEESLTHLAANPTNETAIEWRLRQIVYDREK